MEEFGFIIPSCCKNEIHLKQLKRCISSIRKFHDNKIILIDDHQEYDLEKEINDNNILIIKTENKGIGECYTFKIFLETKLFQKAIFLHDSMILNKKLENIDDIKVKFLWHFTNHRLHWDVIKEPETEYNINNKIITHSDLILNTIKNDYDISFWKFACDMFKNKDKWCGCFGSMCILDYDTLKEINGKTNFVNKILKKEKRDRMVNESLISLLFHYYFQQINFEESYDGLYYDGINPVENHGIPLGEDDILIYCKKNYFTKLSFIR